MKTLLIIAGVIALLLVAFELFGRVVARREKKRIEAMSSDEKRKFQEETRKNEI